MASFLTVEKVSDPSFTATFIEPYLMCGITDEFESTASQVLSSYSFKSLQTGIASLRDHMEALRSEDNVGPIRRNGFVRHRESNDCSLGGNGLFTILMSYSPVEKEKHEISVHYHPNATTYLGQFPAHGFYKNGDRFACCPRPPRVLCGATQDGNHFVLLGPRDFTKTRSCESPVIAIYQVSPPMCLFKKHCKKISLIQCDPIGIALNPTSIMHGQYQVAIVTENMAIILLDVITLQYSTLQLESVSMQFYTKMDIHNDRNPQDNCVIFSPDGRFLSLMCCMEHMSTPACLLINVCTLEPICWMAVDATRSWLRWLFPMFSACGTKVVLSNYSESTYETEYKLMFYKISGVIQSLKVLCRVVILESVRPLLLDQLPLPRNMIVFLGGGRTAATSQDLQLEPQSLDDDNEKQTCRCNLL